VRRFVHSGRRVSSNAIDGTGYVTRSGQDANIGTVNKRFQSVRGTWANSAYFQDLENAAPANALSGFSGVLTREE
jgi:hypothetical protein